MNENTTWTQKFRKKQFLLFYKLFSLSFVVSEFLYHRKLPSFSRVKFGVHELVEVELLWTKLWTSTWRVIPLRPLKASLGYNISYFYSQVISDILGILNICSKFCTVKLEVYILCHRFQLFYLLTVLCNNITVSAGNKLTAKSCRLLFMKDNTFILMRVYHTLYFLLAFSRNERSNNIYCNKILCFYNIAPVMHNLENFVPSKAWFKECSLETFLCKQNTLMTLFYSGNVKAKSITHYFRFQCLFDQNVYCMW